MNYLLVRRFRMLAYCMIWTLFTLKRFQRSTHAALLIVMHEGGGRLAMLSSRFRGCLVGATVGDCLGAFWENQPWLGTHPPDQVNAKIEEQVKEVRIGATPTIRYTDDTVLTLAFASSLVACKRLDHAHLARSMCEAYFSNKERGFSSSTARVFTKLRDSGYQDLLTPAKQQFMGQGSCGNGGAMRVSPAALYGYRDKGTLIQTSSECTKLTHCHTSGLNGALLQSLAVREALLTGPGQLVPLHFIDSLLEKISQFETKFDDGPPSLDVKEHHTFTDRSQHLSTPTSYRRTSEVLRAADMVIQFAGGQPSYTSQLLQIRAMLSQPQPPTTLDVQKQLGHGVLACEAVPCAIYSFLTTQGFDQLIPCAISLGGDTDTIASMAGAIGGAYWGLETIPRDWIECCEGTSKAIELADSLYSLVFNAS